MWLGLDSDLKFSCRSLTQFCPESLTLNKMKMTLDEIDMGAGENSVAKRTYCSCRGLEFVS